MSVLSEIKDRGAVLQWSPFRERPSLVAIGTKDTAGAGFDEYGGEMELFDLDFQAPSSTPTTPIGSIKAASRFSSLAWSRFDTRQAQYPLGLIAGGMSDGNLYVWDPQALITKGDSLKIHVGEHHNGPITGLQFNPNEGYTYMLASGGADKEVLVMAMDNLEAPATYTAAENAKHQGNITTVAWNTGTFYILASADANGSTCVWDMKQRKLWCEIRDPTGGMISDIAWNPTGGTNIMTASGDDRSSDIKLWDLRASHSLPVATLKGHGEGILSITWSPNDTSLLMSTGKDNRTIIWDLNTYKPIYDLPAEEASAPTIDNSQSDGDFFSGGAKPISGGIDKRYQVSWSPTLPAVAATCSFNRTVKFHSFTGFRSTTGRAPKWLRRPAGASFAFGGRLVTFNNTQPKPVVNVVQVLEDKELILKCDKFHSFLVSNEFKALCTAKAADAATTQEREEWDIMRVICFEVNAREELQKHLGFDGAKIAELAVSSLPQTVANGGAAEVLPPAPIAAGAEPAAAAIPPPAAPVPSTEPGEGDPFATAPPAADGSADDLFASAPPAAAVAPAPMLTPASQTPPTVPTPVPGVPPLPASASDVDMTQLQSLLARMPDAEATTFAAGLQQSGSRKAQLEAVARKALVVGNFASAVDCCVEAGLWPEALLLAQCGDQGLWTSTQSAFFEKHKQKLPFLSILNAVIKNELLAYVKGSDLGRWRETLAVLSTYGKSDEFPEMCETLAARLENEKMDFQSSVLCYMCAANVPRVVAFWTAELDAANKAKGDRDIEALQRYVEKVVVFTHAHQGHPVSDETAANFAVYAALLAAQGRITEAPRYLKDAKNPDQVLMDRLYNCGSKPANTAAPAFPYGKIDVKFSETAISETEKRRREAEAAAIAKAEAEAKAHAEQVARMQAERAASEAAVAAASAPRLPDGWSSAVDPTSQRTYYINLATNISQWEAPPMPTPAPAPAPAPVPSPAPFPAVTSMAATGPKPTIGLGGGLGGFAAAPAPAPAPAPVPVAAPVPAPVAVSAAPAAAAPAAAEAASAQVGSGPTSHESVAVVAALISKVEAAATPPEKRQLGMVSKGQTELESQVAQGKVSVETLAKLASLVECIQGRNFSMASKIQADLASTVWADHSAWLKTVKMFIPICAKHPELL